jgi:hypothetical protein
MLETEAIGEARVSGAATGDLAERVQPGHVWIMPRGCLRAPTKVPEKLRFLFEDTDAMSARAGAPGGVSRAARLDDDGGGEGSSSASPSRPASSQAGVAPRPSANTSLPAAAVVADERHPARDDLDQRREQVREASPIGPCSRGRPPAVVDVEKMKQMFGKPQPEAAKALGVSLTTLKQVCRKLGLQRWPYRRPCKTTGSGSATSATGSGAGVPDIPDAALRRAPATVGSGRRGAEAESPLAATSGAMGGRHSLAGAVADPNVFHGSVGFHGHNVPGTMLLPVGHHMPAAGATNPGAAPHAYQGFRAGGMLNAAGFPFPIPDPHMSHMGWGAGVTPGGYESRALAPQSHELHLFDGPGQQPSYMRQQISMQQQRELHSGALGEYPVPTGMPLWWEQGSRMRPPVLSGSREHLFAATASAQPQGRAGHAISAPAPPPYVAKGALSASKATPGMLEDGGQGEAHYLQPQRSPPMPPDFSCDVVGESSFDTS